jgi:hypothetical protein
MDFEVFVSIEYQQELNIPLLTETSFQWPNFSFVYIKKIGVHSLFHFAPKNVILYICGTTILSTITLSQKEV